MSACRLRPSFARHWRRFFHRLISAVWFDRITATGSVPATGPVLLVSRHRNGAVDGFLLHAIHPQVEFMVAARLIRSRWQRLFFGGIPVERAKDQSGPRHNEGAMEACLDHLLGGGALTVFPEGTSTLGPQPLPFHSGAARLAAAYQDRTGELPTILPVGLHYDEPGLFRSRVEVTVGAPLRITDPGPGKARLHAIRRAIESSLVEVGGSFSGEVHQEIAHAAAARQPNSLRQPILRAWQAPLAPVFEQRWRATSPEIRRLAAQPPLNVADFVALALSPVLALGAVLNAPVLLSAHLAAKRLADGPNVVALWKILTGSVTAIAWIPAMSIACGSLFSLPGLAIYLCSTGLATLLWRPLRHGWRCVQRLFSHRRNRQQIRNLQSFIHYHESRTFTHSSLRDESSAHRRQGLTPGQSHP